MKTILAILLPLVLVASSARAQVIFAAPANGGIGLFQQENGAVTPLDTGFSEHNFPSVSGNSQFVVFSSPDPVTPALQVPPSSDVYAFDRTTGRTRRIIDTNTTVVSPGEVQVFRPVSAAFSPDNTILAYGLELSRRSGNSPNGAGRVLIVASAATGAQINSPTDARGGAVSDDLRLEFVGLSWAASGTSFVTPVYVNAVTQSGNPTQLPAIVRCTRNPADGLWSFTDILSTPFYNDGQFPPSASLQIYPALSPSGAGLAYFDLFFPDVLGGSQPATARLIVANSNGANASIVRTFPAGQFPAGLTWSRDGLRLTYSIADQVRSGTGFFAQADPSTAVIQEIPTNGGTATSVAGVGAGLFPSSPVVPLLPLFVPDTRRPALSIRGRKTIETLRKRVVIRGTARDASGIADIDVKARGAKATKVKILSRNRFKIVLKVNRDSGRVIVKLRAVDSAGNRSKPAKLRILRR